MKIYEIDRSGIITYRLRLTNKKTGYTTNEDFNEENEALQAAIDILDIQGEGNIIEAEIIIILKAPRKRAVIIGETKIFRDVITL